MRRRQAAEGSGAPFLGVPRSHGYMSGRFPPDDCPTSISWGKQTVLLALFICLVTLEFAVAFFEFPVGHHGVYR
jgi:hypothetical protein